MVDTIVYKEMYNLNDESTLEYSYVDLLTLTSSVRCPSQYNTLKQRGGNHPITGTPNDQIVVGIAWNCSGY